LKQKTGEDLSVLVLKNITIPLTKVIKYGEKK